MLRVLLIAAALACAAGCTVTRERPNLVGQDIRVTILHTSDIHSRLFPYDQLPNRFDQDYGLLPENGPFGGIARISSIVKAERADAGRSLWLDSGDSFQGAPVFNLFKGEAEVRSLSRAGLDAAVVGNHEFDLGSRNLFEQLDKWATFQPLAANYIWEEPDDPQERGLQQVVDPYAVYDLDGVLVGVIGMGNWSSMTGIFEGGNSLGIRPIEDGIVVTTMARQLRPAVDLVVVLSHLGLDEDEGLGSHQIEIDKNEFLPIENVDLILGGHLHIVLNPPKLLTDEDGNQAVLVHSGAFAKYVGRLDLVVRIGENNNDRDKRSKITAFSYDNIPVDSTVPKDPAIVELLQPYWQQLNGTIDLDGVLSYVNAGDGVKITRNHQSGGDSQLGNLVARSMQIRSGVEAEFALTNSLGIRADFEPGALTIEQMFNVFPFENSITVMYLSGTEVQEMLDFNARKSAGRGCRTQAQTAGIWHDMVCKSDDCPFGCAKNIYLGEDCRGGDPVAEIDTTLCAPLVPEALYRVAVNDYIARGGSGFDVLERNTAKIDTGISLRDALIAFLRDQDSCTDALITDEFGEVSCLDATAEPHDGRIRPVFE